MWTPTNKQQLIQDHLDRLPLKQLQHKHGGTVDKIRAFLQREDKWYPYKQGKVNLPENNIINLYKQDWLPIDIAKKYGVSTSPIVKILDKHNVRKPLWAKDISYSKYIRLNNRYYVQTIYDMFLSQREICEYLQIGQSMFHALAKRYNISTYNSAEVRSKQNQQNSAVSLSKQNFIDLYVNQRKSLSEVSTLFGISNGYLRKLITNKWNCDELIRSADNTRLSTEWLSIRDDKEYLEYLINVKKLTYDDISKKYNCCVDTLAKTFKKHEISILPKFVSTGEREISESLKENGITIIQNDRKTIYPYELDILVPDYNIAIEYCGLYWHSELNNRGKDYHVTKTERCKQKGIKLITIFEDEYLKNKDFIISKILYNFNVSKCNNINARQCVVKEISSNDKNIFLNAFHIQGGDKSQIKLGLFYKECLVSVMTFAKPSLVRSSKHIRSSENVWELNRFATNTNYNVRGAAGKLLSYFKKNYTWSKIYSYADRRWSTGELYTKFKLVEQGFDKNKSEKQIMEERGYTRIWDCGHYKFEIKNPSL